MTIVKLKGMSLLRFLTPTEGWAERMGNAIAVPNQWPLMLVELLCDEDGAACLSIATGVPKNMVRTFLYQGIYCYEFGELPDAIISAIDQHFQNVLEEVRNCMDSLLPRPPKPRLVLVKR